MCSIFVKISFIYLKISVYFLYFAKFNQNVLDHPIHRAEELVERSELILVRRRTSLNLY